MADTEVDLLTIGAGGGAYPAAFRLAKAGARVVMVDPKGVMSGNCLYEGCVPSKAVRETAALYLDQEKFQHLGLPGRICPDYAAVVAHKDAVQNRRYAQHAAELAAVPDLRLIQGVARFIDAHTVQVHGERGDERFHCRHIIIASGSEVFVPPLPGAELALTSHDLYKPDPTLKNLPAHLVIIGGGYIGLETASFFAALGSQVTLLQKGGQVLQGMDPGMVDQLVPLLHPRIHLMMGVEVESLEATAAGKRIVHYRRDGMSAQIHADVVVLAVGRRPVLPEGLDGLGIVVDRHGISVGPDLRTRHPHIYACGDVNGRVPLFHAAVRQSLVAAHNILGGDVPMDYADFVNVPTTIFTLPAAASIGITPARAKAANIELVTGHYAFTEDSRAQILERMDGEIRLFFEPGSLRLVGAWVVGIDAGHLIGEIGMAIQGGLSAYDLARFADQHPMSAEGIGKAARSLF
ncbi:dihydrolipoyl dehydrogenase [Acidithiobacillus caldus]|uniref:Dihydrolipoyl dehydrogenase n=1 Tax=Acidithiobacillus caldus TaxID=33059 RepID=A0A1E7YRF7_9PROT|nr:dihydrolipoyl dehydrogenase [Acidithiobacillus caldus]OFC36089.1 dihydrolipoyl dehydrogenase [Acidithiobacillus caldus]OFC39164.1 dihydrolipoyl dehydrogenase [Acidithiobacillus caldus]OFC39805.1 dihydrolipoyl dehydrogenase [Acidithiobacillus caldus]